MFLLPKKIIVRPYIGFGNTREIYIRGQTIRSYVQTPPEPTSRRWINMRYILSAFLAQPIKNITINLQFHGKQYKTKTDSQGFFWFHLEGKFDKKNKEIKHSYTVSCEIASHVYKESSFVLIPQKNQHYGYISDIDDTFLISNAAKFFKKIKLIFFQNAFTRKPFAGVAKNYQHFVYGSGLPRPLFYISNSEWTLYEFLLSFCTYHDMPLSPFILRKAKGRKLRRYYTQDTTAHKYESIQRILGLYPSMRFILLGDSGQKDVFVYTKILQQYSERISAVYIRKVTKEKKRKKLLLYVQSQGVEKKFFFVDSFRNISIE